MLRVELFDASFEAVKKVLAEVCPSVRVEHVVTDKKLKELGFVDFPPCVFLMDTDWDGLEVIMDELMQIEVDAFNTPDGMNPPEDDPLYLRYLEYGWLWDVLFVADERGGIVEVPGHVLHDSDIGK